MSLRQLFFLLGLPLLLVSIASSAHAQLGTWSIFHVRYVANDRLTVFGEAQIRSLRFYDHFHYYEFKGGATWRLNAQVSVTTGLGRYDTYMQGGTFRTPKAQQEIRSWLEIGMKNQLERFDFDHRYRAEQRFTNKGYRNRFRYRISCSRPILVLPQTRHKVIFSTWNEVFLTNKAPYFERNRFFAGLVLRLKKTNLHAGWVRQFDYRLTDETGRSFLQVGCQLSIDRSRPAKVLPVVEEN